MRGPRRPTKPLHGSPFATGAEMKKRTVYLFGRNRANQARKRAGNQANFDTIDGQSTMKGSNRIAEMLLSVHRRVGQGFPTKTLSNCSI